LEVGDVGDETERPSTWVGHVVVAAADITASADFYVSLGMREVHRNEQVAVLELRGGTHLVVTGGPPAESAAFDLMVDDLDAVHSAWTARGLEPSEIERGRIHDSFTIRDPAGTAVTINSSHVVGPV
jgi:catechol 2,3-dioxygenase-like lactoylglutathione lyase family enzyme